MKPTLRELQSWLRWVVTDPRGAGPALADRRSVAEPKPRCLSFVSAGGAWDAEARLGIYAEAYFSRLAEALSGTYAAVHAALGEAGFLRLAADYLKAHPSDSFNVDEVGRRLPDFIASHPFGGQYPWLSQLAALEWCVAEAFYEEDVPGLDLSELRSVKPEAWARARFELDPAVKLLSADFPVDELWRQNGLGTPRSEKVWMLVDRDADGQVEVTRLTRAQFVALRAMREGACLSEICEQAGMSEGDAPPLVMQWFSDWVSRGVIRAIDCGAADG